MSSGTGLFGWCLPEMGEEQHAFCTGEFVFVNPVVCPCSCHGVREESTDEVTTSSRVESQGLEAEQELDPSRVV
jgi:hypothetical protein